MGGPRTIGRALLAFALLTLLSETAGISADSKSAVLPIARSLSAAGPALAEAESSTGPLIAAAEAVGSLLAEGSAALQQP